MEASQADAGQATAQEGQAPEGQPQEQSQQQEQGQLAPETLQQLERLAEVAPQLQDQLQSLTEQPEEGVPEQQEQFQQPDHGDVLYDEYGNPVDPRTGQVIDAEEQDARALQDYVNQSVTSAVQQAIQPLLEQQQHQQVVQEADSLEQEFPELSDPDRAEEAVGSARGVAEEMGQPELAGDPKFVRLAYLAGKAEQLAAQETPAGSTQEAVQLEGGGGAAPVSPEGDDPARRILEAGRPQGQVLGGLA